MIFLTLLLCAQTAFGFLTETLQDFANEFNQDLLWSPGSAEVFTGMWSYYSAGPKDRRYKFYTATAPELGCAIQTVNWKQLNVGTSSFTFTCPSGEAIGAMASSYQYAWGGDRSWKAQCCPITGPYEIVGTYFIRFTQFGTDFDVKCNPNSVLIGLATGFNSSYRDRMWRLECGTLQRRAETKEPTAAPTTSPTEAPTEQPTTAIVTVLQEMLDRQTALMNEMLAIKAEVSGLKSEMSSLQQKCTAEECEQESQDQDEPREDCHKISRSKLCRHATGCVWDKASVPAQCIQK